MNAEVRKVYELKTKLKDESFDVTAVNLSKSQTEFKIHVPTTQCKDAPIDNVTLDTKEGYVIKSYEVTSNGGIDVTVTSSPNKESDTKSSTVKLIFTIAKDIKETTIICNFKILQVADGVNEALKKVEEEAQKAKEELTKTVEETAQKGLEAAQSAIGGAISNLISVAEDAIDKTLSTRLGIDVSVKQLANAVDSQVEKANKKKQKMADLESRIKELKKDPDPDLKQIALYENELNDLNDEKSELDKEVDKLKDKQKTFKDDMLKKAKESLEGLSLKKDLDNIKLQGGILVDTCKTLTTNMGTVATEGIGAGVTVAGSAGTVVSPSPSQLTGTAQRLQSSAKSLSAPVLSLSQSAANLGVPSSALSPVLDIAKGLGIISKFSL